MFAGEHPRTEGLLFSARHGGRVGDLRKSLDAIGDLCGMDPGTIRSKAFRHTYCSARPQTVQRIIKPGKDPATDSDPYEWVPVSQFQVAKEMGHGGQRQRQSVAQSHAAVRVGLTEHPPSGLSVGLRIFFVAVRRPEATGAHGKVA